MKGLVWKLPLLRRLSPMKRGVLTAFAGLIVVAAGGFRTLDRFGADIEGHVFGDVAQVGGTLLVAYTVEITWLLKASRARGAAEENWVGFAGGIGCLGLSGIACALVLSNHHDNLTAFEKVVASWSFGSIAMLGALVAAAPFLVYDWAHFLRTEYSDE